MAIKTFTTGEVLTAADTNTYLANSGLVYIKQVNLTGTTVNITSCFSSSFDAYRIVLSNAKCAGALVVTSQMLSGSTPDANTYFSQRLSVQATLVTASSASGTGGYVATLGNDLGTGYVIDIYNPFQAQKTTSFSSGNYTGNVGLPYQETLAFIHSMATSYDGISLIATSSTWTTGKAVVYGYRQS
jgi:hypothetical protein